MRHYRVVLLVLVAAITNSMACGGCGDSEELGENEIAFEDIQFEICGNEIDDDSNGLTDCEDRICQREPECRFEPGDPAALAPSLDVTNLSSFYESVKFLVEGEDALVRSVDVARLNKDNVSVVRGQLLDREGNPLAGVRSRIAGKPHYGYSYTRQDGWVDFVVNAADAAAVIRFEDDDVLGVDVEIETEANAFANGRTVVATRLDSVTTRVRGGGVLTDASLVSDEDGSRKLRAFVQPDTTARVRLADGRVAVLEEFTVRATEYTVGERGPDAMPGVLPPESGYTYAVEMSIDEVRAAELDQVEFDKPVSLYVDNFLEFPVGTIVPSGTYDRSGANAWLPNDNGRVVEVVGGGLDVDGDGSADSGAALQELGMSAEEVGQVAAAYDSGTQLWRAPITHFSPHDLNWPTEFPEDARPLDPDEIPDFPPDPEEDPCLQSGSMIECENRVLSQALPVPGTNFSLWYRSDRVPGRGQSLLVRMSGDQIPSSLKRIEAIVRVAGRTYTEVVEPAPNLTWEFEWDGLNAYGQRVNQEVPVRVRVDYIYDVQYVVPADAEQSFGISGQAVQQLREARVEDRYSQQFRGRLGSFDNRAAFGLGGWALDVQSFYDGDGRSLVLPDRPAKTGVANVSDIIRTFTIWAPTDQTVYDMFALSDGRVALVSGLGIGLRKVFIMETDGSVSELGGTLMGEGEFLDNCVLGQSDCGVGSDPSRWKFAGMVDRGPDDALYFLNSGCIRRLDIDAGVYENFAGSCAPDQFANYIAGLTIAVCDHGIYAAGGPQIFRVEEGGGPLAVAGRDDGTSEEYDPASVPGAVATDVYLDQTGAIACGSAGELYFLDELGSILELTPGGTLEVEWTNEQTGIGILQLMESIEGGPFAVGREQQTVRLWKADQGSLNLVAGALLLDLVELPDDEQDRRLHADNVPAVDTVFFTLYTVTQFDDGRILIQDTSEDATSQGDRYREIVDATPTLSGSGLELIDPNGNVLTVYDELGRPVSMVNVRTGAELLSFEYDANGLLSSISNTFGDTSRIERDSSGSPTAIVGYFGVRTGLTTDQNGFLTQVDYADGSNRRFEVGEKGLMNAFIDGVANRTEYSYTADGGLSRVDHPDGTWKTFEAGRRTVTMRTSDGREVVYANGDAGLSGRSTTDAAGLQWQISRTVDGTTASLRPDGVVTTSERSDDPRFGGQARYMSRYDVEQPSGLKRQMTVSREAEFSASDLLDLTSATDTLTVNGKPWKASYDAASRLLTITSPEGRLETRRFDEQGRVTQKKIGDRAALELTFDGALVSSASWGSFGVGASYDMRGFLTEVTADTGESRTFTRSEIGRVVATRAGTSERTFTFDPQGNLAAIGVPSDWMTQGFDARNRLSSMSFADGAAYQFGWAIDGRPESITPPSQAALTMEYDTAGRVARVSDGTREQTIEYEPATGRIAAVETDDVRSTFGYDGSLRISFETEARGIRAAVTRAFDDDFSVVGRTVLGQNIAYEYDDDGLLTRAGSASIAWNSSAPLQESVDVGGFTKTITRDETGLPTAFEWTGPSGFAYEETITYDGALRIASHRVDGPQFFDHDFVYDDAGYLTEVREAGVAVETYAYDTVGNRTSANGAAQSYDTAGRLESVGATAYTFDQAGRVSSRSGGGFDQQFEFDSFNRLHSVTNAGQSIEYGYDGLGRLVSKQTNGTTDFVWLYDDAGRPHAQLDAAGQLDTLFVYAENSATPTYMVRAGQTYVFVSDYLGSVRQVVDSSGNALQELSYDSFGRVVSDTNPGFQPFAFASGLLDPDTGLMTMGKRHYDPLAGRWISADPSGMGGGLNPWVYAENAPTTYVDPDGEVPMLFLAGLAALGAGGAYLFSVQDTAFSAGRDAGRTGGNAGGGNGPVDALRHCTMNCRMTRAYGRSVAELASWYHESPLDADPDNIGSPANLMDEHNNVCGQDIADEIPSDQSCLNGCEDALLAGRLDVLPPEDWTHGDVERADMEATWEQWQQDGIRSERYGPFN